MRVYIARLKEFIIARTGPLWWYSLLMLGFSSVGHVVNMVIGIFIVPAVIKQEYLGAILPLTNLSTLIAMPFTVVLATVLKFISKHETAGNKGRIRAMLNDLVKISAVLSAGIIVYTWISRSFIQDRLRVDDPIAVWLVGLLAILACWLPVVQMASRGIKTFARIILSRILGPVVKLVVILLMLKSFQVTGYLTSLAAANLAVLLFLSLGIAKYLGAHSQSVSYRDEYRAMLRFGIPIGLMTLLSTVQYTIEPWVIRQRLSEMDSAGFYMASMFGYIPMYLASTMLPFYFPLVSEKYEKGESTLRMHLQLLGVVVLIGTVTTILLALFGQVILDAWEPWRVYTEYAPFIWQIAVITILTILMTFHMHHDNACLDFRYLKYYTPLVALEIFVLYGLNQRHWVKTFLSEEHWQWLDQYAAQDLQFTVSCMMVTRILVFIGVAFQIIKRWRMDETHTR